MAVGKSGTFTISGGGGFTLRVKWSETYDTDENSSVVSIDSLQVRSTTYGGKWYLGGTVKVNGSTVQTLSYRDPATHSVSVNAGSSWYTVSKTSSGKGFPWKSGNIAHEVDGSKSVTIAADLTLYRDANTAMPTIKGSESVALTVIPFSSELTVSYGTLGTAQVLTVTKKADSYTHTITYNCGNDVGTIAKKSSDTSIEWTPPLSLAKQYPNSTSVAILFTIITYDGETELGTSTNATVCDIPESVKPSFTVAVSDAMGYAEDFGGYVQTKSKLQIVVDATTMYDATVASVKITANGETYVGSDFTTGSLKDIGENTISVEVIDSRGRKASGDTTITVLAYSPPAISLFSYERCDSDGTDNPAGECAEITFSDEVTSLGGKNAVAYTMEYKKTTDSAYTAISMSSFAGLYSVVNGTRIFDADADSSYDVRLTVADSFGSASASLVVSVGVAIMHWLPRGLGMAIGKIAVLAKTLELGWRIHMNGNKITGLPAPTEDDEAVNLKLVQDVTEKELLWENASPASTFAAQALGIYLRPYSWLEVEHRFSTSYDNRSTMRVPVGANCVYNLSVVGASNNRTGARGFTSSITGITFNTAKYNTDDNNTYAIPTRIWGIKGIANPAMEASQLYAIKEEMTFDGTADPFDTGVKLFDTAKDFTIFMDVSTASGNYNLCILDGGKNSSGIYKGGIQIKTNASWSGDGFRCTGNPTNGAAESYLPIKTTERTKMAVVYSQGIPSKLYYCTESATSVTTMNRDSTYGVWDYVQHDGTVYIGAQRDGNEKFIGTIHALEMFGMALPVNEIYKLLAF